MELLSGELLEEIIRRLVLEFQPEQIILFGSYAWGTPTNESDLDLMLILSESNLPPVKRAIRAHLALSDLGIPKDILVRTRAEFERYRDVYASLECQIAERGKVLYDRSQTRTGASMAK